MGGIEQNQSFVEYLSSDSSNFPTCSEGATDLSTLELEPSTEHILQTIINHLTIFEQRIADSEYRLEGSQETGRRIKEVLSRQLKDGLLSYSEFLNLNHVKQLWLTTSAALSSYNLGCHSSKRIILSNLIDLFTLKEISRERLLNIVEEI